MKTRSGTTIKHAPIPKNLKVFRVSKRLQVRKNDETKIRLAQRMARLAERFEYTPKEAKAKPSETCVQVVESPTFPIGEEEDEAPVAERVTSSKAFEAMRRKAIRWLSRREISVALAAVTAESIVGAEGSGWRSAVAWETADPAVWAERLARAGWRVANFSALGALSAAADEQTTADEQEVASRAPPLERAWVGPEGGWFGRWPDVVAEVARCEARDALIARALEAAPGEELSQVEAAEAARERFLRDGLWVGEAGGALAIEQVASVHTAALEFFRRVMHTVQMRSLHGELERGFVAFRERGAGRFDMNVPALEGPRFDFLRSANAPWMPLVRSLLTEKGAAAPAGQGRDRSGSSSAPPDDDSVKLIHMGVFLSLPESSIQPYHTDGVHLSAECQLPPHALNVIAPASQGTLMCFCPNALRLQFWPSLFLVKFLSHTQFLLCDKQGFRSPHRPRSKSGAHRILVGIARARQGLVA
mmetsp:Transcript_21399/g.48298  ORF Transcript_21399/g.48298 Transcript_21399/m.48298 type:complete len:475 (-) Transcript_21399:520-1944(-)